MCFKWKDLWKPLYDEICSLYKLLKNTLAYPVMEELHWYILGDAVNTCCLTGERIKILQASKDSQIFKNSLNYLRICSHEFSNFSMLLRAGLDNTVLPTYCSWLSTILVNIV